MFVLALKFKYVFKPATDVHVHFILVVREIEKNIFDKIIVIYHRK